MARNPQPWTAKVLSQSSLDSDPAFVITFDDAKYLFNCPENTTRTIVQRKYGFNKYRSIFLSRVSSETSAGLPGFLMSLADSGTKNLKVYGPPGLAHFIASARFYLVRDSLKLEAVECSNEPLGPAYEDANVKIYAIPSTPSLDVGQSTRTGDEEADMAPSNALKRKHSHSEEDGLARKRSSSEGSGQDRSPDRRRSRLQWQHDVEDWRQHVISRMFPGPDGIQFRAQHEITSKDLKKRLPTWRGRRTATSYLLVGPEYRGKFDSALAEKLQVQKPDRAKLARGESVTSKTGKVITPEMVIGPSSPAPTLLVIDCPSLEFIPGLLSSAHLSEIPKHKRQHLHCVFHMAPVSVLEDPRYVKWMTGLGPEVHHVVADRSVCADEISFTASESLQKRLSVLDNNLFRIPWSDPDAVNENPLVNSLVITPARHQSIGMRPLTGPHQTPYPSSTNESAILEETSTSDSFEGVRAQVESEMVSLPPVPGDNVSISCLGTGSAMPGKYRNVSASVVQIPGHGNILLDCGEGTWGQIQRHFGPEASSILRNIKCIFLSHIHADHHMGVARVLRQRRQLSPPPEDPVYLICTRHAWTYLSEYAELEDIGIQDNNSVRLILAEEIEHRRGLKDASEDALKANLEGLNAALGLERLTTAAVEHRTLAFGLVVHHASGWSLTYSGDTKPCQNLVDAGQDSTVLIHEATMADDQAVMAEEKAHSTIGQAVDIAKRMRAKKLLLTHFSTRYPKIPILGNNAPSSRTDTDSTVFPEIFVAFDFLHIHLGDFSRAERYLPNLEVAFSELKEEEVAAIVGK